LFVTVIPEKLASQKLDASVERQDHTTSSSADKRLRQRAACVHRIPYPTSVTIAIRPSCEDGTAQTLQLIWVSEKAKYFFGEG
jgi:hypothetical protein